MNKKDPWPHVTALTGVCLTLQHRNNIVSELVMAGFGDPHDYRGDTMSLELPELGALEEAIKTSLLGKEEWNDCLDIATVIFVLDDDLLLPIQNVLPQYKEKTILLSSFFGMTPEQFTSVLLPNAFVVDRTNAREFAEAVAHHLTYDLTDPGILEPWLKYMQGMTKFMTIGKS